MPHARGEITGLNRVGSIVLAEVAWDWAELPARGNVKNLLCRKPRSCGTLHLGALGCSASSRTLRLGEDAVRNRRKSVSASMRLCLPCPSASGPLYAASGSAVSPVRSPTPAGLGCKRASERHDHTAVGRSSRSDDFPDSRQHERSTPAPCGPAPCWTVALARKCLGRSGAYVPFRPLPCRPRT